MQKAVFLDRDGVINKDTPYTHRIKDFHIIPQVFEACRLLQKASFLLIVITNQAGIARGYYTEDDFHTLDNHMYKTFCDQGIKLEKTYFCQHHPAAGIGKYKVECNCRKPKPGMILQAAIDFDIDLKNSWMIGDKLSDIQAGQTAGCRTVLVESDYLQNFQGPKVKDLFEAAQYILQHQNL